MNKKLQNLVTYDINDILMKNLNLSFLKHSSYGALNFSAIFLFFSTQIFAQDYTIPGEVTTHYPTIINLAVSPYPLSLKVIENFMLFLVRNNVKIYVLQVNNN